MKEKIHPDFNIVEVSCACGNTFTMGTTKKTDLLKVDVCNECHPFYTGKQKMIDTGGRIDKFRKRFNINN